MLDLVIKNGTVVTPEGMFQANLGVDDGKVVSISRSADSASSSIDASGLLVFPGFVDIHVHFFDYYGEFAGPDCEDFESGTKAAASGGVTTISTMPGDYTPVDDLRKFEGQKAASRKKAYVDFAMYGAAGTRNLDNIVELAKGGIIGYKTKMPATEMYTAADDAALLEIFERIAKTGLKSLVHAEVWSLVDLLSRRLQREGKNRPEFHPQSRPWFVESMAVQRVIELAHVAGARAHIVHLSTAAGLQAIKDARARNYDVTTETCPHYLLFTEKDMGRLGPYAKINPPLRSSEDQRAIWEGIRTGAIDFITSDHCPHPPGKKEPGWENIWEARPGSPGLETLVPLILTQGREGRLSYPDIARLLSANPCRVYGLYPQKGSIGVGSDADITIVDPKKTKKISKDRLYSKSGFATLYDGWEATGWPRYTIVRGEVVAEDSQVVGNAGYGAFVSPASFTPAG